MTRELPIWALAQSREEFAGNRKLPVLTVKSDSGVSVRDFSEGGRAVSEDLSGYRVVRFGDLVVNKMWARFGAYGVAEHEGLISPAYWVLKLDAKVAVPRFLHHLVRSGPYLSEVRRLSKDLPPNGYDLPWQNFRSMRVRLPDLAEQREVANYLDAEAARIDILIAKKQRLVRLLEEQIDAAVMEVVGRSEIVATGQEPSVETRRVLEKLERTPVVDEMITAFRDGQVTTRLARGKEGFTNSWTDNARVQGVEVGDVIVHGLDGFSGAIGDSEADGVCSPVYHVCRPRDGGDPAFYGRLLRRLALTGYLGNFAVSTRERAVDFRNWDLFGRIPIPMVRIEQQTEIGDRIRAHRPLVNLVNRSEALAAERKSALIDRVVTGDLDV